jgi:hypothetical protein
MARPPEKKPEPSKPPSVQVLPMNLRLGDVLSDEIAEWRVIGRPYTTSGGKVVNIRVESVKQPGVAQMRAYDAHERVARSEEAPEDERRGFRKSRRETAD